MKDFSLDVGAIECTTHSLTCLRQFNIENECCSKTVKNAENPMLNLGETLETPIFEGAWESTSFSSIFGSYIKPRG